MRFDPALSILVGALAIFPASAQTVAPQAIEATPPIWAAAATIYDGFRVSIGNYPVTSEFGGGLTGVPQALTGLVNIPAGSTLGQAMGTSGYALTGSLLTWAVGTFGFAGMTGVGNAEAGQLIATNCASQNCASATGYSFGALIVSEHDVNVMKTPSGGAPVGSVYGEITIGAGETQPAGDFQAYRIDPPGVFHNPIVPWKEAVHISNGAAQLSLNVGTLTVGTSPDVSQPIYLHSRSASGADAISVMQTMANGDLGLWPSSGTLADNGWGLRISLAQTPSSSAMPCNTGQIQWDGSYVYVCVGPAHWRRTALSDF